METNASSPFSVKETNEEFSVMVRDTPTFTFSTEQAAQDHVSDLEFCYKHKNWVTVDNDAQTVWREAMLLCKHTRQVEGLDGDIFLIDTTTDTLVCMRKMVEGQLVSYQPLHGQQTPPVATQHQRTWGHSARMLLGLLSLDQAHLFETIDSNLIRNANTTIRTGRPTPNMLNISLELSSLGKEELQKIVEVGDKLDSNQPELILEAATCDLVKANLLTVYPVVANILAHSKAHLDHLIHAEEADAVYPHLDCVVIAGLMGSTLSAMQDEIENPQNKEQE